jgi:hypothetical protein
MVMETMTLIGQTMFGIIYYAKLIYFEKYLPIAKNMVDSYENIESQSSLNR